jgi:hypothetical protein
MVLDESLAHAAIRAHALEGGGLDDPVAQRKPGQPEGRKGIGHGVPLRLGNHGARLRRRSIAHCGTSTENQVMMRASRPGMCSARPANMARSPDSATVDASIMMPRRLRPLHRNHIGIIKVRRGGARGQAGDVHAVHAHFTAQRPGEPAQVLLAGSVVADPGKIAPGGDARHDQDVTAAALAHVAAKAGAKQGRRDHVKLQHRLGPRGRRIHRLAKEEEPRIADQNVDRQPFAPHSLIKLLRSLGPRQVRHDGVHHHRVRGGDLLSSGCQFDSSIADQDQLVSERTQARRQCAANARAAPGYQGHGKPLISAPKLLSHGANLALLTSTAAHPQRASGLRARRGRGWPRNR